MFATPTNARAYEVIESNTKFGCLRCGKCCRGLNAKGYFGLFLYPHEIHLFPSLSIKPCLGKGKHPRHSNFKIWAYQLNETNCSHLVNNACKIYDKRPMVCRHYPFTVRTLPDNSVITTISHLCTSHQRAIKSGDLNQEYLQNTDEFKLSLLAGKWMLGFKSINKKKDTHWIFNMKNKK